jgi:hypothetical protein
MAIGLDVDTRNARAQATILPREIGARASLIGSDAVQVLVTDIERSAVGAVTPGLVRVRMSIRIAKRFSNLRLMTPTWPSIPAGTSGVVLIPFETFAVREGAGGVGVVDGVSWASNRIAGFVRPNTDWRGAPFNFLDPASVCFAGETLCSRFETYPPIAAEGWSEPRRVGFELEPSVKNFRVHLVVAADLVNR